MPRDLTHIILADEACKKIDPETAEILLKNPDAYRLGSIVPDAFLYGSDAKLSKKLHGENGEDTRAPLLLMLDDIRQEKDPETAEKKTAFALGYATHMASDITFHPLVYSLTGSSANENGDYRPTAKHRLVETWLDLHFIRTAGYKFKAFNPLKSIRKNKEDREILAPFLGDAVKGALKIDQDLLRTVNSSLNRHLLVGRVTRDRGLQRVMSALDKAFGGKLIMVASGFYPRNKNVPEKLTEFKSFTHPVTAEDISASMEQLTEKAVSACVDFIRVADRYLQTGDKEEFNRNMPNCNLDTGLPGKGPKDIKHYKSVDFKDIRGVVKKFIGHRVSCKVLPSGLQAKTLSGAKSAHVYSYVKKTDIVVPYPTSIASPALLKNRRASSRG